LGNKSQNKAIFLDRDWTLNYDSTYVYKLKDLKILNGVKEWLEILKNLWYKLIIVSNQSWIWRWYYTMEDCNNFNKELEQQLWIKFDDIYICPHLSEENCECRKPKTLFIEKATKKFNLNISQCYMIW
jgi:D,D-heptose 1,7-bisphosphate phosphatase